MKLTLAILLILTFLFSIAIVAAVPSLQPPHKFYGTVTINGQPAQDGLLVAAKINGEDVEAGETQGSGYFGKDGRFVVSDPLGDRTGKTVNFFIKDHDTEEETIYSSVDSAQTRIDLDLEGDLFCGDNLCGAGESCSDCVADCGECPPPAGGNGGSGGGGGGFGGTTTIDDNQTNTTNTTNTTADCVAVWECSDWLPCIGGKQDRVCTQANDCDSETDKPEEQRDCDLSDNPNGAAGEDENTPFDEGNNDMLGAEDDNMITGAAVFGDLSGNVVIGIGILVLIGLVILLFIFKDKIFKD